jgi:hypothetical protein
MSMVPSWEAERRLPSALGVRDGRNEEPQSAKDRQFATSSELHMDAITKNCKAAAKIKEWRRDNRADVLNTLIAWIFCL